MKTKSVFLLAALAVVSLFSVSCSSDEDLTANEEEGRGVVKAEFTIAFPRKAVQGTRVAADIVQLSPLDFRGISNMELYAYKSASLSSDTKLEFAKISLMDPGNTVANIIGDGSYFYQNSNSHLYQDVDVPYGTKTFLFYGKASTTTANESADLSGRLTDGTAGFGPGHELSEIKFSPVPIAATPNMANAVLIETYLNGIADACGADATTNTWKNTDNVPLRSLYESFITITAGSWTNVKAVVSEIFKGVRTANDYDSDKTKALKLAIKTAILKNGITEKTDGSLDFTNCTIGNYPTDNNLPDGAAYIYWNDTKFVETTNNSTTGWNMAPFEKYAYPAALYYHVISDIRTSKESKSALFSGTTGVNSDNTAYTNWNNIVTSTNYEEGTEVTSKTRSIAIVKQVQYAVGRLDVTVQSTASSFSNSKGTTTTIGSTGIEVTGLLVNGQKAVDYKFNQISTEPTYTIYDKHLTKRIINGDNTTTNTPVYLTTGVGGPFYTLVLETPATPNADESEASDFETRKETAKVRIAVEFKNNTEDILVVRNGALVHPGCKFYMIGVLDPYNNTTAHVDPNDATTPLIKKAFMQDYNTKVSLTVNDLSKAYNVLPDLSLPKLELGLSVDLTWKPGIELPLTIE